MMFKLEYSPAAVRDLDRVWEEVYSASQNAQTASRYINELLDEIATKQEFPKSAAPLYYQNIFTGYYYVVFKAYIAFYRVEDEHMRVDRILHGHSDYMRLLFTI